MRTLIARVTKLVLPKSEAKASPVIAACVSGCGGDGVWRAASVPAGGKAPCC